ncbi:hypothetical protein WG66_004527 [Moniliophthora roreri]|nr:hypothetical protein WG66_004527 [Moniliophthora roreri]
MHLFGRFHILKEDPLNFKPDFESEDAGEYGYRAWYNLVLFHGKEGKDSHNDIILKIHEDNNIHILKVTYASRVQGAFNARQWAASELATMAIGGWSESGSFRACYDRNLLLEAMLAAACFNAQHSEKHALPRGHLQPPEVEEEQRKYLKHICTDPVHQRDLALDGFLKLLLNLHCILLQDLAVMHATHPNFPIYQFAPFNSPEFLRFAEESQMTLAQAEEEARMQLQELVPDIVIWVKGFIESETAHNCSCQAEMQREIQDACSALHTVTQTLTVNLALKQKRNVDVRNLSAAQPLPTTGTLSKSLKRRQMQPSTTVPEPHEDEQPATSPPP